MRATGNARAVGLLHHELKVGSCDSIRHFFAQFRKELGDYVVPSEAFPVLRFKELLPNHPVRIDKEISGPGHSFKLADGFVVENSYARIVLESGSASKGKSIFWRSAKYFSISSLS